MPNLTDEEAADLAKATINNSTFTLRQLTALAYIEQNIYSQIHLEHCFVDVQLAFQSYDALYFRGMLAGKVDVAWSSMMTLCAGTCELKSARSDRKRSNWPEGITVRIKLSEPILKFRPSVDLLNTLIHEMIHAYLFIVSGKHFQRDDPSGHGPGFLTLANAINEHSRSLYSITVFHNFHDQVDYHRTHMWQCTGPCTVKPPYFGLVKRAMNRPPGPNDTWYRQHQETCGGDFIKIVAPPEKVKHNQQPEQKNKILGWLKAPTGYKGGNKVGEAVEESRKEQSQPPPVVLVAPGKKRKREAGDEASRSRESAQHQILVDEGSDNDEEFSMLSKRPHNLNMVVCPVCFDKVWELSINSHLDSHHGP